MFEFIIYIFETLKYIATLIEGITNINTVYNTFIKKELKNKSLPLTLPSSSLPLTLPLTIDLYKEEDLKNIINDLTANLEKKKIIIDELKAKLKNEELVINKLKFDLDKERKMNNELKNDFLKIIAINNELHLSNLNKK
jgi:hypothetical protein